MAHNAATKGLFSILLGYEVGTDVDDMHLGTVLTECFRAFAKAHQRRKPVD